MKKHPLQNRTNVQIKGGGGQRPFEQCSKKLHFFETMASLMRWCTNMDKYEIWLQVRREDIQKVKRQINAILFSHQTKKCIGLPSLLKGNYGIFVNHCHAISHSIFDFLATPLDLGASLFLKARGTGSPYFWCSAPL